MDHVVSARHVGLLWALFAPTAALALGPGAPFTPPRAASAAAAAGTGNSGGPGTDHSSGNGTGVGTTAPGMAAPAADAAPLLAAIGSSFGIRGVRLGAHSLAFIDGRWWMLNSQPRANTRLVAIDPHGAWLRHEDGRRERLALIAQPTTGNSNPLLEARARTP